MIMGSLHTLTFALRDIFWQLYGVNEYITNLKDYRGKKKLALDLTGNGYYYWFP